MWDSGQNVLATATVTGSGSAVDGFQYAGIIPLSLTAGQTYVIGANTQNDNYADEGATFTTDPEITYLEHMEVSCSGVTPCYPTNAYTDLEDFGANFQFHAGVPEPASMALVGLGLLAIGAWVRRKKA